MEKIVCRECGQSGGRFRFVREGEYVHTPKCDTPQQLRDGAKNLWDFSTRHINGEQVHVGRLKEMRRLEREHGVVSRVANYSENNW